MRILKEVARAIGLALLSAAIAAGALTAPAAAASHPVIYYTGAQGDPDIARLKFPSGTVVSVNIDHMKSGKSYWVVKKNGKYKIDHEVIIDNGSWVEIRLWYRVGRGDSHPVAIRKTNKPASSTRIK